MDSGKLSCKETAEIMRKKYRYREPIMSGRMVLPHAGAVQLLGPDCVYHLYAVEKTGAPGIRVSLTRMPFGAESNWTRFIPHSR
jgi:hypothetical protein